MERIKLYNRYRENIYLEKIENSDNEYKLDADNESALAYTRVGLYNKDEIEAGKEGFYFIDPAGGPFLCIDSEIENKIIEKITERKIGDKKYFIFNLINK